MNWSLTCKEGERVGDGESIMQAEIAPGMEKWGVVKGLLYRSGVMDLDTGIVRGD